MGFLSFLKSDDSPGGDGSAAAKQQSKDDKKSATKGFVREELERVVKEFEDKIQDLRTNLQQDLNNKSQQSQSEVMTIKSQLESHINKVKQQSTDELNMVREQSIKPLESNTTQRIEGLSKEKIMLEEKVRQAEKDRQDLHKIVARMEDDIHKEIKKPLTALHERDKATREKVQIEYNNLLTSLDRALTNSESKVRQAQREQEHAHEQSKSSWFFHEDNDLDDQTWEQCVKEATKAYDELALFWSYLSRRDALDAVAGNTQFDLEKRVAIQKRCQALDLYQPPPEPGIGCLSADTFNGNDPFCSSRARGATQPTGFAT